MDFDRYGSAPDPSPAYERRTSRDRGLDRELDREPQGGPRPLSPRDRPRGEDPLEQRLDRWVHRGRQLVEGVSGTRPGSRQGPSPGANRPGGRAAGIDGLGRWMEDRFDWLLDDGDDWREPWQEADGPRRGRQEAAGPPPPAPRGIAVERSSLGQPGVEGESPLPRRRLEAVSLRGRGRPATNPTARGGPSEVPSGGSASLGERFPPGPSGAESEAWPEDELFRLERWQRPPRQGSGPVRDPAPLEPEPLAGRPLPRSTRRR